MLASGCSPGGACAWSIFIPGVGQFANEEYGKGALMMGLIMGNNLVLAQRMLDGTLTEGQLLIQDTVGLGVNIWSAVDAYKVAKDKGLTLEGTDDLDMVAQADPAPVQVVLDPIGRRASLSYRF